MGNYSRKGVVQREGRLGMVTFVVGLTALDYTVPQKNVPW